MCALWRDGSSSVGENMCSCGRNRRKKLFICPHCKSHEQTRLRIHGNELECYDCGRTTTKERKSWVYKFHCVCGAQGIGHYKIRELNRLQWY